MVAALIRKTHDAKEQDKKSVEIWGTGTPRRESVFVDDIADPSMFVAEAYDHCEPINVGIGWDLSIRELVELIREVVGYRGDQSFDLDKPDGVASKLLDSRRLHDRGWKAQTSLRAGLEKTYRWYLQVIRDGKSGDVRALL